MKQTEAKLRLRGVGSGYFEAPKELAEADPPSWVQWSVQNCPGDLVLGIV